MGVMTLLELKNEILSSMQLGAGDLDDARLGRWLHQSMYEFGYAFKFRELEGLNTLITVDGTNAYTMTNFGITEFRAMHELGIRKTDPDARIGKLIPESRNLYLLKVDLLNSGSRGDPRYYHKYADTIYLRPVPDDTLVTIQLHYWKLITTLTDNQKPIFTHDWDDIIMTGGLYRAYRGTGDFERYQNVRSDFLGMVRSRSLEEDLEEFPEGGLSATVSEDESVTR